eukprot:s3749_g8.t1
MPAIQESEMKEREEIVENTLEMNEKHGSFTVKIKLPEMYLCHLGLELDDVDPRGPMIVSVGNGVVEAFNTENPSRALKPFDCITAVNGTTGEMKAVVEALKTGLQAAERTMHLTVARPTPYKIILEKSGIKLGAQLNYKPSSQGISLAQIAHGGRFEKWNALNPAPGHVSSEAASCLGHRQRAWPSHDEQCHTTVEHRGRPEAKGSSSLILMWPKLQLAAKLYQLLEVLQVIQRDGG